MDVPLARPADVTVMSGPSKRFSRTFRMLVNHSLLDHWSLVLTDQGPS